MMEAIILAGGFGTRLRHLVSDVPKPMAPVDGRPFLRYLLDDLISKGVERIILAVGYMKECITEYFGSSYRGVEIIYSIEDTPLFTGGAVKQALKHCQQDSIFVFNGDTYFDVDLKAMAAFKEKKAASFVLAACTMQDFDRYGTLELDQTGRILHFREKKATAQGVINGGVYLMDKNFLNNITEQTFSLENDILENVILEKQLFAFINEGYFIDIGVPADYNRAQKDFRSRHPVQKAAFFDRDGTINVDVHYLYKPEDLVFIEGMPEFIRQWNKWGYKVIVVTNQAGIARGLYSEEDMKRLHRYMNERLEAWDAHIDAFYYCPHHPDFTGPCSCRKPAPGMIEKAIREFDLDPAQCILFGDKIWDIEAAKKSSVFGVLV